MYVLCLNAESKATTLPFANGEWNPNTGHKLTHRYFFKFLLRFVDYFNIEHNPKR